jgi:hypothetical protein
VTQSQKSYDKNVCDSVVRLVSNILPNDGARGCWNSTSVRSEAATELVRKAREFAQSSYRLATEFLVESVGVRVTNTKDEAYFADAFNYLCAHLFAYAKMPKEAAEAIATSHVLPGSGGDALFHDAVPDAVALARLQDEAISRGVPALC